jgi:hypothetical protein
MAESLSVVLYGKAECHLCEEAEAIVSRVTADLGIGYRKVDIESSPVLFEQFRYRIPVIEVVGGDGAGGATLDWPTTPERVRRAIKASVAAR